MPVNFLSQNQKEQFGQYTEAPNELELSRYFHLDDTDLAFISKKRIDHNRLGCAVQLCTLRYLGTFISQPCNVPQTVIDTLCQQLNITLTIDHYLYNDGEQRWIHAKEIRKHYGFIELTERKIAFVFTRWMFALCWTGTDRPSVLFERARYWLLSHKVILPGYSVLERFIAKLRNRVEERLWRSLVIDLNPEQKQRLTELLKVAPGHTRSEMERLRKGPVHASSRSILFELDRLKAIRHLHFPWRFANSLPTIRILALARYASTAKAATLRRMSSTRKTATLRALISSLEASAKDDILNLVEILLKEVFNEAIRNNKQGRQRSLKDLDQSAAILAKICQLVLDDSIPDPELRIRLYENIPQTSLSAAVNCVTSIVRPKNDVYFQELDKRYRTFRLFLPSLLSMIQFEGNADGEPLIAALNWLKIQIIHRDPNIKAPSDIIKPAWKTNIYGKKEEDFNLHAYVFCVLDCLQSALKRRDVFISPSWRYSDPRAHLLSGTEWETCKPMVCRALNLSSSPSESMNALVHELDQTYKAVASRFVDNANVRIESGKLKLTPIDKIEEPLSLIELRKRVHSLLPRVDLPELILEVASKTGFTKAFTHISENSSRAEDIELSICAVIMSEACNTGFEPLIKPGLKALKRDRLSWVAQNYLREKTIKNANAILVKAHSKLTLSSLWGGGEIASADGMRFTVPVKTVHAGPNPKYFGPGKGVTWYNLLSDQHSGLNDLPVPGTLRDSLSLLAVVLEQQTELQPTEIMTDTGAYSDVIFGLFRLLGYRFSPRLADIGSRRFWRIDTKADYGELNDISTNMIKLNKITPYWEDMLRISGSLKLGKLSALDAMKTLQVGDKPTGLAKAIAEYGRIDKTIHLLTYIDDEAKRHVIQKQLNRVEGRHNLAREVFHGKRGELRKNIVRGKKISWGL